MLKGIIFDLDGLLIDSEPAWREADFLLSHKYGFVITDEFRKQLFGKGLHENSETFIKYYNLNETVERFTDERLKLLHHILFNKLELMPYARQLIQKLKTNHYQLALATVGHNTNIANEILTKLELDSYFSHISGALDVARSKPFPDIYIETARKMNIAPSECIVLEDTVTGALAGKLAGMYVIGINKDSETRKEFKPMKADYIFPNLDIPLTVFEGI